MSGLSGYDSDVVGFDSVSSNTNPTATSSSQTTEYGEQHAAAQTRRARDVGCMARPDDGAQRPPTPPGLVDFLRRVAPLVAEQLDRNDADLPDTSSNSDEEETVAAKLVQEITGRERAGSGDHERSILSLSWSGGGDSLAASAGRLVHDTWCRSPGSVAVYTRRREDGLVPALELPEGSCVTALRYHPTAAALLAYGTAAGDVVVAAPGDSGEGPRRLVAPTGHAARRVSALHWLDAAAADSFLLLHIRNKNKRRGAADQVLVSAGSDGAVNAWQVNASRNVLENIVCYRPTRSRSPDPLDITCFDFARSSPAGRGSAAGVFVVGSNTGRLLLCKVAEAEDPVLDELAGHATCVLEVAFGPQRPEVFVSLSMDSELRVYDVKQGSPLKVISADACVSCVRWLDGRWLAAGLAGGAELLRVYSVASGRALPVAGLAGRAHLTCLDVTHKGLHIAAGDKDGTIRIWELPPLRNKWN